MLNPNLPTEVLDALLKGERPLPHCSDCQRSLSVLRRHLEKGLEELKGKFPEGDEFHWVGNILALVIEKAMDDPRGPEALHANFVGLLQREVQWRSLREQFEKELMKDMPAGAAA